MYALLCVSAFSKLVVFTGCFAFRYHLCSTVISSIAYSGNTGSSDIVERSGVSQDGKEKSEKKLS